MTYLLIYFVYQNITPGALDSNLQRTLISRFDREPSGRGERLPATYPFAVTTLHN
jgi:hypothetical protein